MTKIVINGYKGRMGQTIISCAAKMPDINIVGKIDIGDSLEKVIDDADVCLLYTSPSPRD